MKITEKEIQELVSSKAILSGLTENIKKTHYCIDKLLSITHKQDYLKASDLAKKASIAATIMTYNLFNSEKFLKRLNKKIYANYKVSDVYDYFINLEQVKKTNTSLPKIYISGKISGIEDAAPQLFQAAEDMLLAQGFEVVNPMKLPHNHDKSWDSYMKEDIDAIRDGCTHIYMLKNWRDSRGARNEINEAMDLKLTIIFEK
jgi:Asp-tRNA(Asn)/Glu-tRNA(Gln) amidotransferase A subunit family amidase